MGLAVADEYVEPGASGRSMAKREKFQEMLRSISRNKDIDAVIVYKLSRLARDRIDEALVMNEFKRRGVKLISATEPIDDSPEGQFMQGILSAMNQFRSQQDGATVAYNMAEKAKKGGTIGLAPIGYINTKTITPDGYQASSVEVDGERAPFIRAAFELCIAGHTIADIAGVLAARGLSSRATPKHPAAPLAPAQVHRILHNPYYTGVVIYQGEEYAGRHPAIISRNDYDKAQAALAARGVNAARHRIYEHPLKGMLYCGQCRTRYGKDRRMTLQKTNGNGGTYWYYFCSGHVDHTCDSAFINVRHAETAVAKCYETFAFSPETISRMNTSLDELLAESATAEREARQQLEKRLAYFARRENKLVELAIDDALPRDIIRQKLANIKDDKAAAEQELARTDTYLADATLDMRAAIEFLADPAALYRRLHTQPDAEKMLHTAIFQKIYIDQSDITDAEFTHEIAAAKNIAEITVGGTNPISRNKQARDDRISRNTPQSPNVAAISRNKRSSQTKTSDTSKTRVAGLSNQQLAAPR